MDITSFEVSQLLHQAGYPKPAPAFGTRWYGHDGTPYIVICQDNDPRPAIYTKDGWDLFTNKKDLIYAPTVSDLVSSLGGKFRIDGTIGDFEGYSGPVFWISNINELDRDMEPSPICCSLVDALAHKLLSLKASGPKNI